MEAKELVIKDICCRLPYGVKVKCPSDDKPYTLLSINWNKEIAVIGFMMDEMYVTSKQKLVDIKPYLRPLSSMTDEEKVEYGDRCYFALNCIYENQQYYFNQLYDWLNKKMFDYRGLIPKGLANSTEKFNPYKD